ncbi:MAG: hypothetical protein JNN28_13710 [Saprospiraceae bacterium]|nr:hypothetical protein [Saprospiraceae bacterium]
MARNTPYHIDIEIDLNVGPMPFSAEDRQEISAIIAQYKSTGEIPKLPRKSKTRRKKFVVINDSVPKRMTRPKKSLQTHDSLSSCVFSFLLLFSFC